MAVYLAMVRIGQCEVCLGKFYLEGTVMPDRCPHCTTTLWLYGISPKNSRLIRQGVTHNDRVLNKGVKSKGRQEWSRAHPPVRKKKEDDETKETAPAV